MGKSSKVVVQFYLPTTSYSRIGDGLQAIFDVVKAQRGEGYFATISGPHGEEEATAQKPEGPNDRRLDEQRSGSGRASEAREAFEGGKGAADAAKPAPAPTASADDGKPRASTGKRGRPPGSRNRKDAGEAGASEERPERRERQSGDTEDARGDEPVRTREVSDEGAPAGGGRARGADRSRDDQRGDREAPRLKVVPKSQDDGIDWGEDDEWGGGEDDAADPPSDDPFDEDDMDEAWIAKAPGDLWPIKRMPISEDELTIPVLSKLLSEHHMAATGGSDDRSLTRAILAKFAADNLKNLDERDYWKFARTIVKDTMRYVHGVKAQKL